MRLIPQHIIDAIERERQRQEAKFPGQKLPATAIQRVRGLDDMFSTDAKGVCACNTAGLISEIQAKVRCDDDPDWSRVLVEEVSEAVSAAGRGDAKHARQELIEVAAVALRWIEAIDRGGCGL